MKIKPILTKGMIILFLYVNSIFAQTNDIAFEGSCTSIMVGKKASVDGSVMTSHTCDGYYRTWLEFVPAQKFDRDTTHGVHWGTMHTHTAWSNENVELKGTIPEVKETYAYLNTAYPCLNEKQLAIGETTFGGKRELRNKDGLFLIEELERIVLQRCTTARQAIQLIGELIKKYGYGDYGECITIADKNEVWHMEILGEGPDNIGGVWAAQRIPDDHVGISANISRIAELDLDNKDYFMASENVFKVAKEMGFWDGKEPFKFWKAYGKDKAFAIREFFVFSSLAPSLNLNFDAEELPFSVKPEKKVDIRDIFDFFRTTYDGTDFEMIRNLKVTKKRIDKNGNEIIDTIISPSVHPWMDGDKRHLLNTLSEDIVNRERPIAVQYCAYSFIVQLRDWLPDEIGGRLFFSFDIPRLSPRIPIYAGNLNLLESFKIDNQDYFSRDAAGWSFRRANRLALVKWGEGKNYIEPVVAEYENRLFSEIDYIEKHAKELWNKDQENAKNGIKSQLCRDFLTQYTNDFARATINKWWELGDKLWVKFKWNF